ncbi:MAG: hypothetical protein D8M59_09735 [Planctomycetes bacterium]|nr:hypothetical protein [Planctomycetota bacterium]NOG53461.1 hypothetical protein [Planctomycetota bacterium]
MAQESVDADPSGQGAIVDPQGGPISAFGDLNWGPIDAEAQTLQTGNLGVEYLDGMYYVSTRVIVGALRENAVNMFDSTGTLVGTFDQVGTAYTDAWGYRDGFTDGSKVYFGWGGGIASHNPDGTGGAMFITGAAPVIGTWRALAYDPNGDGGNGSIYACDFGDPIIEVDMAGNLIRQFANADGWSIYGLALDPNTGNLWAHHSSGGGAIPPQIWEIDTTTGTWTGVAYDSDAGLVGGTTPYPIQGGLCGVPGGNPGSGNSWDLCALLQALSDSIAGFEGYASLDCLNLSIDNNNAGTDSTFTLSGLTPGSTGAVLYSLRTGSFVYEGSGYCVDFGLGFRNAREAQAQLIGQARDTDGDGVVAITIKIPCAAGGKTVYFQGAEKGTCPDNCMSNVIKVTFLPC